MHLVEVGGRKILLDCGLYQGRRKEAFERNRVLPFDAAEIDAVVLSHAHIDHSGNLPSLVKSGFRGSIYATPATRDLCAYMLVDSAHLQENDVRYVNKRRKKQGKKLFVMKGGPGEQALPNLEACDEVTITVKSKDIKATIAEAPATVSYTSAMRPPPPAPGMLTSWRWMSPPVAESRPEPRTVLHFT